MGRRRVRVYCTGLHSEAHDEQPVYPVLGPRGAIFECPLCKYDVRVDRGLEGEVAELGDPIELHHLAQLVTRERNHET
jgi:hypothetical protein